ncbi:MAG: hypothetical protein GY798_04505 [Hyphomicrobiales bacterium]|nr:hypothetical protein [Hyphomicrobiales bacterium]
MSESDRSSGEAINDRRAQGNRADCQRQNKVAAGGTSDPIMPDRIAGRPL